MNELVVGELLENDEWELLHQGATSQSERLQELLDAIKKHKPLNLSDLFTSTKDRKLLTYAMELMNIYAEQRRI